MEEPHRQPRNREHRQQHQPTHRKKNRPRPPPDYKRGTAARTRRPGRRQRRAALGTMSWKSLRGHRIMPGSALQPFAASLEEVLASPHFHDSQKYSIVQRYISFCSLLLHVSAASLLPPRFSAGIPVSSLSRNASSSKSPAISNWHFAMCEFTRLIDNVLTNNTDMVKSPMIARVPLFPSSSLTPFLPTLTLLRDVTPFRINSYAKHRGGYPSPASLNLGPR
jgi:hypothetical protein